MASIGAWVAGILLAMTGLASAASDCRLDEFDFVKSAEEEVLWDCLSFFEEADIYRSVTAIENLVRLVPNPFLIDEALSRLVDRRRPAIGQEEAYDILLQRQKEHRRSLMHLAVENPDPDVMAIIHSKKFDPDSMFDYDDGGWLGSKRGTTPLHLAAGKGKADHVAMLLAIGASPYISDRNEKDPFDLVMPADIQTRLIFHVYDPSHFEWDEGDEYPWLSMRGALTRADFDSFVKVSDDVPCDEFLTKEFFSSSSPERIRQCFKAGALLDGRNQDGETPLHLAAAYGDIRSVQAILRMVSDEEEFRNLVNLPTLDGNTPVHYAAQHGRDQRVIPLLVALGADIYAKNHKGRIPLHLAAKRGDGLAGVMVAHLLAAEGKRYQTFLGYLKEDERKDNDGNTPLHLAASRDKVGRAAAVLLAHGYSPTTPNKEGLTPLMYAAFRKGDLGFEPQDESRLFQLLLDASSPKEACKPIDSEYKKYAGKTVLDFAKDNPALNDADTSGRVRTLAAGLVQMCAESR